jgi:hypothetical protein
MNGAAVLLLLLAGAAAPDPFLIQLGAERSEAEAAHRWIVLKHSTAGVLDGLEPKITPVTVPHRGKLWRLRAGPVDQAGATSICAQLKVLGADCIVVH